MKKRTEKLWGVAGFGGTTLLPWTVCYTRKNAIAKSLDGLGIAWSTRRKQGCRVVPILVTYDFPSPKKRKRVKK